nr:hypothetical protein [Tanacetum cinerariifolium]
MYAKPTSGNPTFSLHKEIASPKVTHEIHDSKGCNFLSEELPDIDSFNDIHPRFDDDPLSGSTTYSANSLLEEFANELALITYHPDYDDNRTCDIESDLREIEIFLYQGEDSGLKDSIDQTDLANLDDLFVDPTPKMFVDEKPPDYSFPLRFDVYPDDFLEIESDADTFDNDSFDSKGEKIKEAELLIDQLDLPCDIHLEYDSFNSRDFSRDDDLPSPDKEDKVFNPGILIHEKSVKIITRVAQEKKLAISFASLLFEDFDPPFYELLVFKEVPNSMRLLLFSSENEEKVFKPGIYIFEKVYSCFLLELSHPEYLKDLEECIDDGDSWVAKEMKLFDALVHKSIVIKVDGPGAWDTKLDLADLANYVTKKVLDSMGFVHVSISDYGRKMVNDVNVEIHRVKFKADFVVLDYANEWEPSIMFGRDFLATTKSQVNFGLDKIRMNLTMFKENYVIYKKKLDEILMGKERLNKKDFSEEDKVGIIKHDLPKKTYDLENYVLPMKVNGVVETVALVDTEASAMGKVKNVRIQIGYQAYVVDLLVLDILVDPELPLLLGRPLLRTCGAIIDTGRGTLCIDDEVIRYTYFPKPRFKSYVETFKMEGEDDWLGNFEAGRDEDGNAKYGPVAPSFLDIEDDMERALAIEAYFNPFKNIIDTLPNPLIVEYEKRNKKNKITYSLQPVSNGNLKWKDLPSVKRHTYCERLSKLQDRSIGVPRVGNWGVFSAYGFKDTLRNMMKLEYIYKEDGDVFVDYSWWRALSINDEVYPEWVLELFSTMYFDKDVDKSNMMMEKCIWFRLCGNEHILTLLEFAVVLGTKESSVICACHYVTKIAISLGYCLDDEIKKCLQPIDCEYWTMKMLAEELDEKNQCLLKETGIPTQVGIGSRMTYVDVSGGYHIQVRKELDSRIQNH